MELQGLESEWAAEDPLLHKLSDSRRRFQRRMQQLIAKYEHPFEDAPLVEMSTLTYKTPQGLRIWGGKLVKEVNKGQIQVFHVKSHGLNALSWRNSESSDADAASDLGDLSTCTWTVSACTWTPAVPQSPLRDELRRKYLTQVDILLQGARCLEGAAKGVRKDTPKTPALFLASPAMPAPGYSGDDSTESLGNAAQPAPSPRAWGPLHPRPADLAVAPSSPSCLSTQSSEANDICNVTISDLYAGMLHSMSRLLSAKPSCIISTKTFIVQNWSSRRRQPRRSGVQMNETYCKGARPSRRSTKERSTPYPEPRRERGTVGDSRNLPHVPCPKTGFELEKAFLDENKPQLHKFDPSWKELQVTPRKRSSLTSLDFNMVHLDWESRLMTLKWLISPVKKVSLPRMPQGCAENRYREIGSQFNKLHQACCPDPGKQLPRATGRSDSWALAVYRGGCVSPDSARGLETCRPRLPFSRAKAKSLSETFEHLGTRSVEVSGGPPKRASSSSISKTHPPPSPGHSLQTCDLFQGRDSGTVRKAVLPNQAISVPRTEPPSCPKSRYDEIKEKFDCLHQKYFQTSPQQGKVLSRVAVSADKAGAEVQCPVGDSCRELSLDTFVWGFQWFPRSLPGSSAVEAQVSAGTARGASLIPAKRRRLSDPQVCGLQSRGAAQPLPAQRVRKVYTCLSVWVFHVSNSSGGSGFLGISLCFWFIWGDPRAC
ncbi:Holliday junction recognition protein [Heterocephalus glaber]|uniref:Holliday junction recognition protein n=1 Tax=Heterocephalus glaber TaxID=10181 RepID=G5BRP6_HETGA|nr:Holliday junction recognition protein [Heterocephalus glaber]